MMTVRQMKKMNLPIVSFSGFRCSDSSQTVQEKDGQRKEEKMMEVHLKTSSSVHQILSAVVEAGSDPMIAVVEDDGGDDGEKGRE